MVQLQGRDILRQDADKIFNLKVKRLKSDGKSENIPLINLKGTDEIERGGNTKLPSKTPYQSTVLKHHTPY